MGKETDSRTLLLLLEEKPDLALIMEKIQKKLEEEKNRRLAFHNDLDESVKAEFINGEILLHSPVTRAHALTVAEISRLLGNFVKQHHLGEVHIEKTMIRLTRNDYEPDVCFFKREKASAFTSDQKLFPAPDLVVEVLSKSTEKVDRGIKFDDYAAHGVGEYWIVDTEKKVVEQYVWKEGVFEPLFRSEGQEIRSDVVDGFVLSVADVFAAL